MMTHPIRSRIRPARVLAAICLVSFTASLVVAVATPWGEANDEPDHVRNVETILGGHWYRIEEGAGFQPHQPPLYYLGLAGFQKVMHVAPQMPTMEYSKDQPAGFRHDLSDDGAAQRFFMLLRLPSLFLSVLTILLTAAIAKRVSRDPWTPVVAAAIVAFLPKFVFLSGVINNDNLGTALAAAATLLATIIVTTELTPRRYLLASAGLGALAGLLAITKFSTLPLVAAFVVALVVAPSRQPLRSLPAFATLFVATSGWWFAMNTSWYGDPLAKAAAEDHLRRLLPGLIDSFSKDRALVDVPQAVWSSFVYSSGWNQFEWPTWWYLPTWALIALGLAGLVARHRPQVGWRVMLTLGAIVFLAASSIWLVAINTTATQARIAFIGLPALATLVALGYERLRLPVLTRFALPIIGLVGVAVSLRHDVFGVFWT